MTNKVLKGTFVTAEINPNKLTMYNPILAPKDMIPL